VVIGRSRYAFIQWLGAAVHSSGGHNRIQAQTEKHEKNDESEKLQKR
jgi:hypothetical protein